MYFTKKRVTAIKKIATVILAVLPLLTYAQKEEGDTTKNFIASEVADSSFRPLHVEKPIHIEFPHLFKEYTYKKYQADKTGKKVTINHYYDLDKIEKIKKLENSGAYEALLPVLEDYVRNFAVQNFYKDTYILWRLAELYEKFERHREARAVYRLVLKHHNTDLAQEIEQYYSKKQEYEDLTVNERDYYVPLDFYYELVEYRKAVDTLRPPKSVLLNMGELVNKKGVPDYAPTIHENMMIFTRRQVDASHIGHTKSYEEHLYYSIVYGDFWDEAVEIGQPINSKCKEGSACLSNDGKTLIFARCAEKGKTNIDCRECLGSCDLYSSTLTEDSTWTKPLNLGENVNSEAWDSQPTLSHTGDTLYFASNRLGGFGLSDIYFCVKQKDGSWSKAQNMGPVINTRGQEISPFYHPVYDVLYFSSNWQLLNFDEGKTNRRTRTFDIYKAYHKYGFWNEPKNIGPLVNGQDNENYFAIDKESKNLYYARTEEGATDPNITDLYSFPLPMEAQPTATVKLKGLLTDSETGDPLKGIVSIIDLKSGIEVAPKNVRPDGTYEFDLIDQQNYLLVVQGDDFFRIEKLFYLDGDTEVDTEAEHIKNKKLQFSTIVFENGKARILPEMEKDLWNVINFLLDNPNFDLKIAGHTDSDGNANLNTKLSQDRADAIKRFIVENGYIAAERIEAKGYGSTQPIRSPEVTEEDKRINRRVEFEIFYVDPKDRPQPEYSDEDFMHEEENADDGGW